MWQKTLLGCGALLIGIGLFVDAVFSGSTVTLLSAMSCLAGGFFVLQAL